jgi:hypothetical protein
MKRFVLVCAFLAFSVQVAGCGGDSATTSSPAAGGAGGGAASDEGGQGEAKAYREKENKLLEERAAKLQKKGR